MEVTSNLDAPNGWRMKMAIAEVVDQGIVWHGGRGFGSKYGTGFAGNRLESGKQWTRPKFHQHLSNHTVGNNKVWRAAGKKTGKIYA